MPSTVEEIMTRDPVALPAAATLDAAATRMRDQGIGDVIVLADDGPCGVVTDRDIVVRAIADGRDPRTTTLEDVCSHQLVTVAPDDPIDRAAELMRSLAIRRLP